MFTIVKVTNYSNNDPLIETVALMDTFQRFVDFIEQEKDNLPDENIQFDETNYNYTSEKARFYYTDLENHLKVYYKSFNLNYTYKPKSPKSIYSDRNE